MSITKKTYYCHTAYYEPRDILFEKSKKIKLLYLIVNNTNEQKNTTHHGLMGTILPGEDSHCIHFTMKNYRLSINEFQ